jgi:flagellum-specific ATP synthase
MERAGKEDNKGSITAFFTVLIEGDDMSDPIADQSRSILDGHIVLSRELTDFGIYPPINILNSASRVMSDIISDEHKKAAIKLKKMYTLLKENEVLIRIGAYTKGNDPQLDEAILKKEKINNFLSQDSSIQSDFTQSVNELIQLVNS